MHSGAEFDGRMRAWGACGGSSILPAPTKREKESGKVEALRAVLRQ